MIEYDEKRYLMAYHLPDWTRAIADRLGVPLSARALRLQRLASWSVALIDATWDEDPAARASLLAFVDKLARWQPMPRAPRELSPELVGALSVLHVEMSRAQAEQFYARGRRVLRLWAEYSQCSSPRHHAELRRQEARLFAYMVTCMVPDVEREHQLFGRYAAMTARIFSAGNVLDSLEDIFQDYYRTGGTRVRPTPWNVAVLTAIAVRDIMACLPLLGPRLFFTMLKKGHTLRAGRGASLVRRIVLDESVVPEQLRRRYSVEALRTKLDALLETAQATPGRKVERDDLLFDRALLLDNLLSVWTSDGRTAFNVHLDRATGWTVKRIDVVGVG